MYADNANKMSTVLPAKVLYLLIASFLIKAFLVGIAFSSNPKCMWIAADTDSYWRPAQALMHHYTFSSSIDTLKTPETIRTPGYPLFLGSLMLLSNNSDLFVVFVQICLSLLTIFLTFRIATLLFNRDVGIIAAFLCVLDLTALTSSLLLLSEALFNCLLIISIWSSVIFFLSNDGRGIKFFPFIAGTSLAMATLVRPVLYYFLPVFIIWYLYMAKRKLSGSTLRTLILILLPLIILVGGWQVRNYIATGNCELSSIQGYNMLYYRAAGVISLKKGVSLNSARIILKKKLNEKYLEFNKKSSGEKSRIWNKEGLSIIAGHPILYLQVHLKGSVNMFLNPGIFRLLHYLGLDFENSGGSSLHDDLFALGFMGFVVKMLSEHTILFFSCAVAGLFLGAVYIFSIRGLAELFFKEKHYLFLHSFIICIVIYILLISGGPEAHDRFREPVMPLLCIYAGFGFVSIIYLFKNRFIKQRFNNS